MVTLSPFYPVLPDASWISRLVPLGIRTVQLRLKGANDDEIKREIEVSLKVCDHHGATLIVNDYWRAAISLGATYLHLGQEDLAGADLSAIKRAGLAVGISSHDHAELKTAMAAEPDYIALGPIYETTLKVMPWRPQGLGRIAVWKERASCPIVAIGGITVERANDVIAAGATSAAVVTDIITAEDPEARTVAWIEWATRQEEKN